VKRNDVPAWSALLLGPAALAADYFLLGLPVVRNGPATYVVLAVLIGVAVWALALRRSAIAILGLIAVLMSTGAHMASRTLLFRLPAHPPRAALGERAAELDLRNEMGEVEILRTLRHSGPLVLVFIRGSWSAFCRAELRGLARQIDKIHNAGAALAVVSGEPVETNRRLVESMDLPFHILSDPELKVTRQYVGVFAGSGPGGKDTAHPGTVVIDSHGRIKWISENHHLRYRTSPAEIAAQVRKQ
jgi:peroxiredoxin